MNVKDFILNKWGEMRKRRHISSSRIIILGFLSVILAGTLLLMLPFSARGNQSASFLEALFTATSAVCVTGLVVRDTATYWSAFGHVILLILIQIGGMGVVTMAVLITRFSGRKIGLMQRSVMQETISAPKVGGIVRLTLFIIRTTVCIELAGAVLMLPVFIRDFGILKGICYSVFHSVSAFCNAGFDLMGVKEPFSSLTSYSGNVLINAVIMMLIVVGGIGFLTWDDIRVNRQHLRKYRLQSKVVLFVTAVLLIIPAIYFFFYEFRGPQWENTAALERGLEAMFQSVTLRTAGFNTVDFNGISEPGRLIMILWMLIGGSPGSTAGGMKTTTIAVLIASGIAVFRRKEDAQMFRRRIAGEVVTSAAAILLMYLVLFLLGGILISCMEKVPILTALFETASAIGTVGVTMGITSQLGAASRIILILLMFLGRVGGLTVVFAAVPKNSNFSKLPQEKITVG